MFIVFFVGVGFSCVVIVVGFGVVCCWVFWWLVY